MNESKEEIREEALREADSMRDDDFEIKESKHKKKAAKIVIVGFIFAFSIPPVGLILNIVGLLGVMKDGNKGKKLAIAGIILGAVLSILLPFAILFLINNHNSDVDDSNSGRDVVDTISYLEKDVENAAKWKDYICKIDGIEWTKYYNISENPERDCAGDGGTWYLDESSDAGPDVPEECSSWEDLNKLADDKMPKNWEFAGYNFTGQYVTYIEGASWYGENCNFSIWGMGTSTLSGNGAEVLNTKNSSTFYKISTTLQGSPFSQVVFILKFPYDCSNGCKYAEAVYTYDSATIRNNDGTITASWVDGSKSSIVWVNPVRGCGLLSSGDAVLTGDPVMGDLEEVGTINGITLYKNNSPLIRNFLYSEFQNGRQGVEPQEVFNNALNNVVFKDGLGSWRIWVNSEWGVAGECAKPVIYLYPVEQERVSVEVGANVRVSDPEYPVGGWKSVMAEPDGKLTYQGETYRYLFWDGLGRGLYPDVEEIGTLSRQENLVRLIQVQLYEQGLNRDEIIDFVEFWHDKMPQGDVVRLSWLSIDQLDELAPMTITPNPDTVIRVFLDAESIDVPRNLARQSFSRPIRNGFTVVEWGGLLDGISH